MSQEIEKNQGELGPKVLDYIRNFKVGGEPVYEGGKIAGELSERENGTVALSVLVYVADS